MSLWLHYGLLGLPAIYWNVNCIFLQLMLLQLQQLSVLNCQREGHKSLRNLRAKIIHVDGYAV
jgi:hypothetical protein